MENMLLFMTDNPVLTFALAYLIYITVFRCWNRLMRHLNIRKSGWPPSHCDADGEFRELEG